jgi:superfamily II DNA/RNA helicase
LIPPALRDGVQVVVLNYDLPQDPEDYFCRIGRTGRAGRSGRAVSFVFGREIHRLEMIERYTRLPIRRERVPTQEVVEGRLAGRFVDLIWRDHRDAPWRNRSAGWHRRQREALRPAQLHRRPPRLRRAPGSAPALMTCMRTGTSGLAGSLLTSR